MTSNTPHSGGHAGYETKDANVKAIFWVALFVMVFVVVSLVLINEYFISVREKTVYEYQLAPESAQLREVRAREDELLYSYGVVDTGKGLYRIPIDEAMRLVAEESYEASKNK